MILEDVLLLPTWLTSRAHYIEQWWSVRVVGLYRKYENNEIGRKLIIYSNT